MTTTPNPPIKRDAPYIWATWLSPLLGGSHHCRWAVWFQANYKFDKSSDNENDFLAQWKSKHEELLHSRADHLEAQGYTVYLEDENLFRIEGNDKKTIVSGKPDIVAIRGEEIIVEDCKTGRKQDSHPQQVLLYMLLLPLSGGASHCKGKKLSGRLVYLDEVIDIPANLITDDFKQSFKSLVHTVSAENPARIVPSTHECRYCKVPHVHCDKRKTSDEECDGEDHDLF